MPRYRFVPVIVVATALAATPAFAAESKEVDDLAGCSGTSDPDCSLPPSAPPPPSPPDPGPTELEAPKLIAWTSAYDINPFNGSRGGIFISRHDGSGQRRLTEFENGNKDFTPHGLNAPDDHPSFSPDGRRIVFSSNRANRNDWDIYVMDVNGSNVKRLTTSAGIDTEPVFSPDGQLIVFSSTRSGSIALWTMRADGTNQQPLLDSPAADLEPAWRADGNQLVYTQSVGVGKKDLYTVDVLRVGPPAEKDLVATGVRQITGAGGEDHDATYSPSGDEVVYTTERPPFAQPFGTTHRLRLDTLLDNGHLTSDLRLAAGDPFWSFDGKRIAFFKSSTRFIRSPQQLWIMAPDGSQKRQLPGGSGVANVHPAIGPVANVDADSTPDYLESGSVGRASLKVARRVVAGRPFTLRLGWEHPVRWRLLRSEFVALTLDGTTVGLVRYDVDSGLFYVWDSVRARFASHGRAGQRKRLRAGALTLDLSRTRVINVSRKTLALDLSLGLTRKARGKTLGIEARADDASGASQQDRRARARITVTGR